MKYASGETPRIGDRVDPIATPAVAGVRTVVGILPENDLVEIARTLPLGERGGSVISLRAPDHFTLVRRSFPAGTIEEAGAAAAYSNDPTELEIAVAIEQDHPAGPTEGGGA